MRGFALLGLGAALGWRRLDGHDGPPTCIWPCLMDCGEHCECEHIGHCDLADCSPEEQDFINMYVGMGCPDDDSDPCSEADDCAGCTHDGDGHPVGPGDCHWALMGESEGHECRLVDDSGHCEGPDSGDDDDDDDHDEGLCVAACQGACAGACNGVSIFMEGLAPAPTPVACEDTAPKATCAKLSKKGKGCAVPKTKEKCTKTCDLCGRRLEPAAEARALDGHKDSCMEKCEHHCFETCNPDHHDHHDHDDHDDHDDHHPEDEHDDHDDSCRDDPNGNCAEKVNKCKVAQVAKKCPETCDKCGGDDDHSHDDCQDEPTGNCAEKVNKCQVAQVAKKCKETCGKCDRRLQEADLLI